VPWVISNQIKLITPKFHHRNNKIKEKYNTKRQLRYIPAAAFSLFLTSTTAFHKIEISILFSRTGIEIIILFLILSIEIIILFLILSIEIIILFI